MGKIESATDVDTITSEIGSTPTSVKPEENKKEILAGSRIKKTILLISIFFSIFFTQYPHVGLSPSIAKVSDDLHDSKNMSWYMTSFTLASVIFQLLGVRISDCLGRRRTALYSMALFIGSSLLVGFSINGTMFVVFRAIQGMSTGVIQTTLFASMVDLFSTIDRLKYQPRVALSFFSALVISPVICGVLVDSISWRWIFWLIPIGCLPVIITLYLYLQIPIKPEQTLSKENLRTLTKRIDPIGCILISTGIGFFLLAMHLASASIGYTWSSPIVIGFLSGSVGIFILFLIFEKYITSLPLFPSAVVLNRDLFFCYFQQFSNGWQYPLFDFVLFIEYQAVFNATTTEAAFRIIPGAIVNMIVSTIGSYICPRLGTPKPLVLTGLILMIFSQLLLLFVQNPDSSVVVQMVILAIYQAGLGFNSQFNVLSAQMILEQTHPHLIPLTISLCRCLIFCGVTCSISFSLSFLHSSLSVEMENLKSTQPAIFDIIQSSGAQINYTKVRDITSEAAKKTIQHIYHRNIRYIFYAALILTSLGLIGACFERVPNIKRKKSHVEVEDK